MSDSTAAWMAENGVGQPLDYVQHGPLLARRAAERDDRQAERAEAEHQAELAEVHDARMAAFRAMGVTPGAAMRRAQEMADLDVEIATHREAADKLERRRSRLAEQSREEAEALSRADTLARRSAHHPDAFERARLTAQEAFRTAAEKYAADTAARRSVSRPKGFSRRSAPVAAAAANGQGLYPPGCNCMYRDEDQPHTDCWPSHPYGMTDLPDTGGQAERADVEWGVSYRAVSL